MEISVSRVDVTDTAAVADVVDVAFALHGRGLPRDHRLLLTQALLALLPGLTDDPFAAVHPVKVVHGLTEVALLSARSRLLLRVSRARRDALAALAGRDLRVGGHALRLGTPQPHELLPHNTLYAHFVDAGEGDEASFLATVESGLRRLDLACHVVCGRRQQVQGPERLLQGHSLLLHGLRRPAAQRVLAYGLGAHRLMGCGVFVPHKSAAAVGD